MKTIVSISRIRQWQHGQELFDLLKEIYPQGARRTEFSCKLPAGDPALVRIERVLSERGLENWSGFGPQGKRQYRRRVECIYEDNDFTDVKYVTFNAKAYCAGDFNEERDRLELDFDELKKQVQIAKAGPAHFVVSSKLRRELEDANFKHLVCRPAAVVSYVLDGMVEIPWEEIGDPLWHLTTDLVLPPMSDSVNFLDIDGNPAGTDYGRRVYLREGETYNDRLFNYTAESLKPYEPFDMAMTYEWGGRNHQGLLVASSAFRDFCRARKLLMTFEPVRLEG